MFKHPMTSYSSGMVSMFFLLSVLLVCCRGGTFAATDVEPRNSNEVVLFKAKKTQLPSGEESSRTGPPNSFDGHSLLDVDGMMVALAIADFRNFGADNSDEIKRDIWAKHIKYGGDERTISEITKKENEGKWKTQVAVKVDSDKVQYNDLFGPRAVAKGNKIHFLLTNMTTKIPATEEKAADISFDLEWVVGEVTSATGGGQQEITWKPPTPLKESLTAHMTTNKWTNLLSGGGRGVVAGGSTIVFPLRATTADYPIRGSISKGYICSAIYTEDDGKTWSFPSKPVIAEGCTYSTLLEWEGKLLMVTVSFLRARNVYESTDKGRTWNKATGPIAHLLSDSDAGPRISSANDLITATIADRNVILFTQVSSDDDREKGVGSAINIWLSDGTRMHNAGPISTGTVPNFYPFSALLHTNNELFALYERAAEDNGSSGSVVLTHLTEQLERITSVLETWKEVDERVSTSCTSATKKDACTTPPMPTTGLIGFLSNNSDGAHWADEYLGVNAVVLGRGYSAPAAAKKVENGFTLSGSAGRIEWPVGEQRSQQAYSFVNDGLTLVATVSINKAPAKVTPLVGVLVQPVNGKPRSSERYLGLWYDESKRWRTEFRNQVTAETIKWEEGQTYQVTLTIQSGTGSAYVDGKRVGSLEGHTPNKVTDQEGEPSESDEEEEVEELVRQPPRNKTLYVLFWDLNKKGNEEGTEIQVTVKNVFLYNHAFNNSEMEALIPMDEKSTVQNPRDPQNPPGPQTPQDPRDRRDPQDPQDPRDQRDPQDPRERLPSSSPATKTKKVAAADTSPHGSVPRMSPLVLGLCVFVLLGWVV